MEGTKFLQDLLVVEMNAAQNAMTTLVVFRLNGGVRLIHIHRVQIIVIFRVLALTNFQLKQALILLPQIGVTCMSKVNCINVY